MATPIAIDVVSDVVCPWCYVGKRRLDSSTQRCRVAANLASTTSPENSAAWTRSRPDINA